MKLKELIKVLMRNRGKIIGVIISVGIVILILSAEAVVDQYSIIYEGSTIRLDNSDYNSFYDIEGDKIIFEKVAGDPYRYDVKVNSLSNSSICNISAVKKECEYGHYKIIVEEIEPNNLLKIKVLDTRLIWWKIVLSKL